MKNFRLPKSSALPKLLADGKKVSLASEARDEAAEITVVVEEPLSQILLAALAKEGGIEEIITDVMADNVNKAFNNEGYEDEGNG